MTPLCPPALPHNLAVLDGFGLQCVSASEYNIRWAGGATPPVHQRSGATPIPPSYQIPPSTSHTGTLVWRVLNYRETSIRVSCPVGTRLSSVTPRCSRIHPEHFASAQELVVIGAISPRTSSLPLNLTYLAGMLCKIHSYYGIVELMPCPVG